MKRLLAITILGTCLIACQARATVTIQVAVGDLQDQNGTLTGSNAIALLVADSFSSGLAGLTNLSPNSSLAVGTALTDSNETSVAQIVDRFVISASSGQNGQLSDIVTNLVVDLPLATGQHLWLMWFPSLTSSSTELGSNTWYGVYRDTNTPPLDVTSDPWVIPADGTPSVTITALSPSEGGLTPQSDLMANYRTIGSSNVVSNVSNIVAVAGSYSGLVQSNSPLPETTAFITFTVANTGSFTAKLTLGGALISFKGKFDSGGSFSTNFMTRSGATFSIALQGVLSNGFDQITGTVSDGSFTSDLIANRSVFNARSNPATQFQGSYTVLLAPGPTATNDDFPQGVGYGTLKVDTGGKARLSGTLGDGTKFSQTAVVSQDGSWPVYIPLYARKGLLSGWLTFTNIVGVSDLDGTLLWARPPQSLARFYHDGFTNTVTVEGAKYTVSLLGTPVLNVSTGACNLLVTLGEGNLNAFVSNTVTLNATNKVALCVINKFKLTVLPGTGLFSGSFSNTTTQKSTKFGGAVSRKRNLGAGLFLGTNQTGFVTLEPEP